jgi:AraC-like DNA-binding protein
MAFMSAQLFVPVRSEKPPFKVTDTHLFLPSLGLANCVRAYASRNTCDIELGSHERLNHYAATPLCTLIWMIKGEGELISKGGEPAQLNVPGRIFLGGPHNLPSVTKNIGDVQGFMAFIMPDALQALTGIDIESLVDQFLPLEDVLDPSWVRMSQEVLAAQDDATRIRCMESFLLPRWQACRRSLAQDVPRYQDWMVSLATRAALTGVGKSARQLERRVKRWSGQSLQRLRGFARAETSFFEVRDATAPEMLNWAEVAFNMGFSDQAHMCREVRRVTGFSPEEFKRALETEEGFWLYRLWM